MSSGDYRVETRQRILEAACEVFSEFGFRGTSVRQIVARAGTNLASVNYHFGGKAALYRAVMEKTLDEQVRVIGDGLKGQGPVAPPGRPIRKLAETRIKAGLMAKSVLPPRLIGWEIVAPSVDLRDVLEDRLAEAESHLAEQLEPLAAAETTGDQMAIAARWFLTVTLPPPPVALRLRKALGEDPDEDALDGVVRRLADAAIAGVRALLAASPPDPSAP